MAFEVASIKLAADPGRVPVFCMVPCTPGERFTVAGNRVEIRYMSLHKMVMEAYLLKGYQLQGPDWMATQRFDIDAKLPEGGGKERVPEMLQTLLAERFKLAVHRDTKEENVFAMVVGKGGLKLAGAAAGSDAPLGDTPGAKPLYTGGDGEARMLDGGGVVASGGPLGPVKMQHSAAGEQMDLAHVTIAGLVELIAPHAARPVIDATGLKGAYQMHIAIEMPAPPEGGGGRKNGEPRDPNAPPPPDFVGDSFMKALDRAGLKLEPRKAPVEILVVDRLEKTPTAN
jgi:uncharacterized protein (TIGR03435 family)